MIRVIHHRSKCIGCYACEIISPEHWRMSKKDGKSVLLGSKEKKGIWSATAEDTDHEKLLQAENVCPARVIQVRKI